MAKKKKTSAHTPGKWSVLSPKGRPRYREVIINDKGQVIADFGTKFRKAKETQANAREVARRMNMDLTRLTDALTALRNSCRQGEDGSWDCSTEEGKEGFDAMVKDCEEIAEELGIKLPTYKKR